MMLGRVLVNMIIIPAVILTVSNGIVSKSYANVGNSKIEYVISQSEESNFLEKIYKSETDTLKIKSIDKQISKQNYIDKEITETKILDNSNEQYIRNQFGETRDFEDEKYKGTLKLTDYKVENINNGYYETIDEKVLTFNNYTDNDLINIEKEIVIDNTTYYLINVNWMPDEIKNIDGQEIPKTYKGEKIYQTVKNIKNPDTYKVTAVYKGQIELKDTLYNYKVLFEEKVKEDINKEVEENTEDTKTNVIVPIIISGAGIVCILWYVYKKGKDKKRAKNTKVK